MPEETKEVEMKDEENTMDELILQYAKTMKEIEDQDCYEQHQMQLDIDALRDQDDI